MPRFPRLADEKREGIVAGRDALSAGQIAAPGLNPRGIKRVALRTHLHHQSVQPAALRRVEQTNDLRLLGVRGKASARRKINVVNGGDPRAAKIVGGYGEGQQQDSEKQAWFHQ